jgi:hypothetical protein
MVTLPPGLATLVARQRLRFVRLGFSRQRVLDPIQE